MCNESSCCAEKVLCIPVSSEKRWIKEERGRTSAMSVQDEQRTRIYRKQERTSSEPQTMSIFASVRAYMPAVLIT